MISQIEGQIRRLLENRVELDVHGITYEVLLPARAYQQLRTHPTEQALRLFTFHYLEGGMTSLPVPRLVGFLAESDREFFQLLRTVKNMGVKTALNSMMLPVGEYASAIESENVTALRNLPEIGPATAKRLVSELKGKLTRFLLMPAETSSTPAAEPITSFKAEAVEVLLQLGRRPAEAEDWVARVSTQFPDISSSDDLLTEIFKQYGSSNR